MRVILNIALLLTTFSCLQAQNNFGILYNQETWKAEMAICHSRYDSAFIYYNNAFRIHTGWSTDYYNLALLAIKMDRPNILYPCLDSLASKGFSRPSLEELATQKYAQGDRWKTLCARIADYSKRFEQRYAKIKNQLDSMVTLDQQYAGNLPNDSITQIYHKIVYQNGTTIINLINSDSIPLDNIYYPETYKATQIPLILVHHYLGLCHTLQQFTGEVYKGMDFAQNNLDTVLFSAVQQGKMTPYCFVKGKEAWTTEQNPYVDAEIQFYNGKGFTKPLTAEQEIAVNRNRGMLGLGPLSENRVRALIDGVLDVNGSQFKFYIGSKIAYYESKNIKSIESIKKALVKQGWVAIN